MATCRDRTRALSAVDVAKVKNCCSKSEGNAKFDSIRAKVKHEVYGIVQQKWSKGLAKVQLTFKQRK